jgi:hypothetical protein
MSAGGLLDETQIDVFMLAAAGLERGPSAIDPTRVCGSRSGFHGSSWLDFSVDYSSCLPTNPRHRRIVVAAHVSGMGCENQKMVEEVLDKFYYRLHVRGVWERGINLLRAI